MACCCTAFTVQQDRSPGLVPCQCPARPSSQVWLTERRGLARGKPAANGLPGAPAQPGLPDVAHRAGPAHDVQLRAADVDGPRALPLRRHPAPRCEARFAPGRVDSHACFHSLRHVCLGCLAKIILVRSYICVQGNVPDTRRSVLSAESNSILRVACLVGHRELLPGGA